MTVVLESLQEDSDDSSDSTSLKRNLDSLLPLLLRCFQLLLLPPLDCGCGCGGGDDDDEGRLELPLFLAFLPPLLLLPRLLVTAARAVLALVFFGTTVDPWLASPLAPGSEGEEDDLSEAPLACDHLLGCEPPRRNLGGKGEP
ncbi:hypothetical protein BHE74_00047140 [Ensete ventricosum]|nr:hypothetical protein BHE74_00047140 [Ensete ventricosum]